MKKQKPSIPAACLENHLGILGKTGSGKTIVSKGLVEYLLIQKERVCIFDPTGVWYGLRTMADGKTPAFDIPIFGGPRADVQLNDKQGDVLGELIGSSDTSAIVDVSSMKVKERTKFFTDFAETLYRVNQGKLYLILDEADCFAPQGKVLSPQAGEMLHATNNLLARGRSRGLNITLICQRPAKLHKDSLSQVETLIAMKLKAPQDRKAVKEWIDDCADPELGKEVLQSLPNLAVGSGWVWGAEQDVLKKQQFPMIQTADTSAGPNSKKIVLKKIDLATIQEKMDTAVQAIIVEDPRYLKNEILKLKRELEAKPKGNASAEELARAYKEGYDAGHDDGVFDGAVKMFNELRNGITTTLDTLSKNAAMNPKSKPRTPAQRRAAVQSAVSSVMVERPLNIHGHVKLKEVRGETVGRKNLPSNELTKAYDILLPEKKLNRGSTDLSKAGRKILNVLAQYNDGRSKVQVAMIAGYSSKSGSFNTYLSSLRSAGYIGGNGECLMITNEGLAALGDFEPLPSGEELFNHWYNFLGSGSGAKRILETLINLYPANIGKERLGEEVGMSPNSGSFNTYLSKLNSLELIERKGGMLQASHNLFQNAA